MEAGTMNKKEILNLGILIIGILVLAFGLLHDYLDGTVIDYGIYDITLIVVGAMITIAVMASRMSINKNLVKSLDSSYDKYALYITIIFFFIVSAYIGGYHTVIIHPDSVGYLIGAGNILNAKGYDSPFHQPGYSLAIAVFNLIISDMFVAGKIVSLISATILVFVSYHLIKKIFNKKNAIFSQIIVAISYTFFIYSFQVLSDMMFACLFCISVYLIIHKNIPTFGLCILAGVFGGLAYLTRYTAILLLLVIPLFLVLHTNELKRSLSLAAIYIVSFFAAASPWLIIRYLQYGDPFYNKLYYSVAYEMYGGGNYNLFYIRGSMYTSLLDIILSNPKLFFMHWTWTIFEEGYIIVTKIFNPLVGLFIVFGFLLALILLSKQHKEKLLLAMLVIVTYCVGIAISHIEYRYLLPIIPFFAAIAIYPLTIRSNSHNSKCNTLFGFLDKTILSDIKIKHFILMSMILATILSTGLGTAKCLQSQPFEHKEIGDFLNEYGNRSDVVMGYGTFTYYIDMKSGGFLPTCTPSQLCNLTGIDYLIYDESHSYVRGAQFSYLLDPSNEKIPDNFKLIYYRQEYPRVAVYEITTVS